MKKPLIIGFALFGAMALAAPATVFAQAAKADAPAAAAPAGDENVTYKAKTVYDFEDDTVEGDLQRPDGELVSSQKKAQHSSLIEIRKDFIPEMLKSLEDV
jgi:polyisoprenoid-binding protein YceI